MLYIILYILYLLGWIEWVINQKRVGVGYQGSMGCCMDRFSHVPHGVILLWFQLTHVLYTDFLGFVQAKDKMPEFHEINAAWPQFKLNFSSIAIPKAPTPPRYLKVVSFPERTASKKVLKTTVADSPTFHHLSPKTFRRVQCHTFMKHN